MAEFAKGNRFWELRATHGRGLIFSSPAILWEAAKEYFEWCEDNPLIEIDFRGKDATQVELPKIRAFTEEGLCLHLHVNTKYFYDFVDALKDKDDETSKDFSEIIRTIREIITIQQFTGAAAGFLNANIIARKLGLTDKKDLTTNGENINTTVIKWGDKMLPG